MTVRRVGIVGYGHLGKYLVESIKNSSEFELAFVWNRTASSIEKEFDEGLICRNLKDVSKYKPDLIVEVAHPDITKQYGTHFLSVCDYFIGSPTAMSSKSVENMIRKGATTNGAYIPAGALWGGEDVAKMADRGTLKELKITMKKHPSCFKLKGYLSDKNDAVQSEAVTLYEGPVRELCDLAPNNVNTMAAACIAGHTLGFDKVIGSLISDPSLHDWHIVEVDAIGPTINGNQFRVHTSRNNPADPGAVTGSATYGSFYSSMKRACGKGPGVHLC